MHSLHQLKCVTIHIELLDRLSVVTFYVLLCLFASSYLYLLSSVEYCFNKCLNISVKLISVNNLLLPSQVVLVQSAKQTKGQIKFS